MDIQACEIRQEHVKSAALNTLCTARADPVMNTTGPSSLKNDSNAAWQHARDQLDIMFRKGVFLSLEMYSQYSEPAILDSTDFAKETYSISSTIHEPDRCMSLDDNDKSFDGRLIDAIVVPGLTIYGDTSGTDQTTMRVIHKAQVLLFKATGDLTEYRRQPIKAQHTSSYMEAETSCTSQNDRPAAKRQKLRTMDDHIDSKLSTVVRFILRPQLSKACCSDLKL